MEKPILYIIIPCYNEQSVLPITAPIFRDKLLSLIDKDRISPESKILFIDDGSNDSTWKIIKDLSRAASYYIGIRQSRNRGHQNAVLAGLMEAKNYCDITISIDCDGQDDINAMDKMVEAFLNGYQIVYGVRSKRDTDTFFKRVTAESFYKLLNWMGAEVIYNHADYRLLSSKVLQEFSNFKEVNIFLRGMIPLVGFESTTVYYERHERIAGESHYPIKKMLALAFNGITSLSVKPIRIISGGGIFITALSLIGIIRSIAMSLMGNTVNGWVTAINFNYFLGGLQLISLGVLGEYIGKIYLEAKRRPRYIISERTGFHNEI